MQDGLLAITYYSHAAAVNKCVPIQVRYLRAHDSVVIPAGVLHRFACLADCQCTEAYWPASQQPTVIESDIVRFSGNGYVEKQLLPEFVTFNAMEAIDY